MARSVTGTAAWTSPAWTPASDARVSMVPILLTLAGCFADVTNDLGEGTRALADASFGSARGVVVATWRARHFPPPVFGMPPHDASYVGYDVRVVDSEGRYLRRIGTEELDVQVYRTCEDRAAHDELAEQARLHFARLVYEGCANDEVWVFRVRDPTEDPPPWRSAIPLDEVVALDVVRGDFDRCADALAAVGSRERWARDRARERRVCLLLAEADPVAGLRCAMRETDWIGRSIPDDELAGLAREHPEALVEALDATAADTTAFAPYRVAVLLAAAPDPAALASTQARLNARCSHDCLPWERFAGARIAALRGDREAGSQLLERARGHIAAGEHEAATALLVGLPGGVDEAALAEVMRSVWTLPLPPLYDWDTCSAERALVSFSCIALPDAAVRSLAEHCAASDLEAARKLLDDPATPEVVRQRAVALTRQCPRSP